MFNPQGPVLPPPQAELEAAYKRELAGRFGIVFNRLLTLANMPIQRFGSLLVSQGQFEPYLRLLQNAHDGANLAGVMCRSLLSIDWFLLAAPVLVARWMLSVHELFHLRTVEKVDPVTALLPLVLTPFSLGYREMLDIHRQHHRQAATPEDSEYFQLRGPPWLGLLNALSVPEQAWLRRLRSHGLDRPLLTGMLARLGLFAALAWVAGAAFWAYFIPVRLAFGLSNFAFFYCLHRQGDGFGTYPLSLPAWAGRVFGWILGEEAMLATCHHDMHHAHPRIAARHLAAARAWLALASTPLTNP